MGDFPDLSQRTSEWVTSQNAGRATGPASTIRVSSISKSLDRDGNIDCLRRAVMDVALADTKPRFPDQLLAVFEKGNEEEALVVSRLRRMAFSVSQGQEQFSDEASPLPLTGHTDGRISWDHQEGAMLEIKSVHPNAWPSLERALYAGGLYHHPHAYMRGYESQLRLYMMLAESERGVFVFSDRGEVRMTHQVLERRVSWETNARYGIEKVRELAARIIETRGVAPGDDPDILHMLPRHPGPNDPVECEACPHRALCMPGKRWGEGTEFRADFRARERAETYIEHATAASEAAAALKKLKAQNMLTLESLPADQDKLTIHVGGLTFHCKRTRTSKGEHKSWRQPHTIEDRSAT